MKTKILTFSLQAHLSNDTSIVAAPLTLPVRRTSSVHAALGPLKAESRQGRTFVPLYLNTNNTSSPFTVHFVVSLKIYSLFNKFFLSGTKNLKF